MLPLPSLKLSRSRFISKFILSLGLTEEMLATFSAVSVLYNFHAVFKVNLNGLFCIHYIMLSIRAGTIFSTRYESAVKVTLE